MIDYHIHTSLCNHAKGPMEAYVLSAAKKGFKEICFLDHLTITEAGKHLSMATDEVFLYYHHARMLQHQYKDTIDVKVGLEIDFNPVHLDACIEIIEMYAFDAIGSSLHFLNGHNMVSSKASWKNGSGNTDYVYKLYFETLAQMIDSSYFDIICHLDMIKKFNRRSLVSFEKEIDMVIKEIKKKNIAVEINTSGFNHPVNDMYPGLEIIKKCREQEVMITIGSDAHDPESVGQHFDKAFNALISSGYTHFTTFAKRSPGTIPIPGFLESCLNHNKGCVC